MLRVSPGAERPLCWWEAPGWQPQALQGPESEHSAEGEPPQISKTTKQQQIYSQPVLGLAGPGLMEKEKTKAAEVNTMGSIKEVNESDISEANSPNPTPRLKDQRLVEFVIN